MKNDALFIYDIFFFGKVPKNPSKFRYTIFRLFTHNFRIRVKICNLNLGLITKVVVGIESEQDLLYHRQPFL